MRLGARGQELSLAFSTRLYRLVDLARCRHSNGSLKAINLIRGEGPKLNAFVHNEPISSSLRRILWKIFPTFVACVGPFSAGRFTIRDHCGAWSTSNDRSQNGCSFCVRLLRQVGHRAWTQSVQGAVATWSTIEVKNRPRYLMPITDQVATAPCTDYVQARRPT